MSRSIHLVYGLLRCVLVAGVGAGMFPVPVSAVDVEPYAFGAYRDGSLSWNTGVLCITITGVNCPVTASTDDGDDGAWGLGAALRMSGPWWLDLRWSRQETEARYFDALGDEIAGPGAAVDLNHLHAGVLYRFLDAQRWTPFVTAFGGLAQIDADPPTPGLGDFDLDRFSAGLGGGLLVDLAARVGLRFELRGIWTDLPSQFDGDLEQVEGSAGLRLRF